MPEHSPDYNKWRKLFLFCLGTAVASAFCMKWMEPDLVQNGRVFTILGLELTYPKETVESILGGLDPSVKRILTYHLFFDLMFMVGVFPGVAALLMMGRTKSSNPGSRRLLLALAILQLLAWGSDITENIWMLTWLRTKLVNQLEAFRILVLTKWFIVSAGIIIGIIFSIRKNETAELRRR